MEFSKILRCFADVSLEVVLSDSDNVSLTSDCGDVSVDGLLDLVERSFCWRWLVSLRKLLVESVKSSLMSADAAVDVL